MANDFCPFLNGTCRANCRFITHVAGVYGTPIPVCSLAEHCKDIGSVARSLLALTKNENAPR